MTRLSITLLAFSLVTRPAVAQRPAVPPAARIDPHAIEVELIDRWLHGRQQSRFTPFHTTQRWLFIDSVRERGTDTRTLFLSLDRRNSDQRVTIVARPDGRLVRLTASRRQPRLSADFSSEDSARFARMALFDDEQRLALPASKAWDVTLSFHPARLQRGEQWLDTIALSTEEQGSRQALSGVRVSTLVGDTTINGRRLWIVSDSAAVRYDERATIEERTLDTLIAVDRSASGTVRGRMLYDPRLGLFRARSDTTVLAGRAVLRYPDGRSFETPARYERRRVWHLYDPSEYNARRRAIESERERTMSEGVVFSPTNNIDRALVRGDLTVRDSLVGVWQQSREPNEWAGIYSRLAMWGGRDTAFDRRLDDLRIAAGDTAFLLQHLAKRPYVSRHRYGSVDSATMAQLVALMAAPDVPFAFDVSRDPFYEDLTQALLTTPPASTRDTAQWPCTPAACQLLAGQWSIATEPRLKQVGLIAHFVLDPRRWTDTVLAYVSPRSSFLDAALLLARGVGATWSAASKATIPAPGADWRAWIEWMNGQDPAYTRRVARMPAAVRALESSIRFEESDATAIRFTEARTGREIIGELKQQFAAATSDSALLVYEYMLNELGEYRPTAASVAAHFRSGSPARMDLGAIEVPSLFGDRPSLADSATAIVLMDRLIAMNVGGQPPWREVRAPRGTPVRRRSVLPLREVAGEKTLLLADSLPPVLRAKWGARVPIITAAEWANRSERTGGTLFTLTSVARVGAFARLGIESEGRIDRRADQAPWLYYGGTTYYLMELDGEWVLVSVSKWVT